MVLRGRRFGLCTVLLSAISLSAVLQMEVEAHRVLGALGDPGGQQVRRQGTAQQRPMRRLAQARGADNLGGIALGGAVRGCTVCDCVLQAVELHRVGQPCRGGRHQGHRVRLTARMLTGDHPTLGQYSQALAVGLAGALRFLGGRVGRLLLCTFLKLGVEPQLAGGGCGQIGEGEGKVHGGFSAGEERNGAGVKPAEGVGANPCWRVMSIPNRPSPREVDFQVSRETLQKINLYGMI